MRARFLQVAKRELDDAVDYYNREKPGLGYEFLWEVFFAIDRIKQFSQARTKGVTVVEGCLHRFRLEEQ
jgi:hypothetical protein